MGEGWGGGEDAQEKRKRGKTVLSIRKKGVLQRKALVEEPSGRSGQFFNAKKLNMGEPEVQRQRGEASLDHGGGNRHQRGSQGRPQLMLSR